MLKYGGLFCLFFGCTLFGISKSVRLGRRLKLLEELRRVILILSGEIRCIHTPLPEAFVRIGEKVQPPFREFLEAVAKEMEGEERKPVGALFEKYEGILRKSELFPEDIRLILELGREMGYLDIAMQLKTLELYEKILDTAIKKAAGEYGQKARMYRYLGVLMGLFVVILLF